jgi:hypothetical protein
MRTTVTIDPDVETLLNKAMRERDASFKQVLNDAVRSGLQAQAQRQAATVQAAHVQHGQAAGRPDKGLVAGR